MRKKRYARLGRVKQCHTILSSLPVKMCQSWQWDQTELMNRFWCPSFADWLERNDKDCFFRYVIYLKVRHCFPDGWWLETGGLISLACMPPNKAEPLTTTQTFRGSNRFRQKMKWFHMTYLELSAFQNQTSKCEISCHLFCMCFYVFVKIPDQGKITMNF